MASKVLAFSDAIDAKVDEFFEHFGVGTEGVDGGLRLCCLIFLVVTVVSFVTAELTNNVSQTDKLWSLMPPIYAWVLQLSNDHGNARQLMMTFLASLWGMRLTLNFTKHGGYNWPPWKGEEDYRWVHVRKLLKAKDYPVLWILFDLTFIAGYCHLILLGQILPMYIVAKNGNGLPLNKWDAALFTLVLFLIAIESIADEQHQEYQQVKEEYKHHPGRKPQNIRDGFFHSKLFWFCRHPNYAAEQMIWITMYLISVNVRMTHPYKPSSGPDLWIHWSMLGAVLLVLLFTPSAMFSESISKGKYSNYAEYQKTTWMFFPFGTWGTWANKTEFP
mmetsp:Transcript_12597/g.24428  ORF Transcript_12597/g.24428 Transcript_12597/m.24428 type:complete len:331 (+) Transcript_12597:138-1130(+)|eukprot:CAMPEP_0171495910 /NCGR_PEP_ID=MMETSP0958-20121227/6400_1 /TAXON_ID=87120 /ORGANISM="Aurantiochytrium limacinum, Strain ATCCMYA-1381" /LENGTH=330 /DNA_ID=CAMNT_0012029937 /DNA_START=143 /DNA_END=1135 /DNA_ORIENTATION=-